MLIHRERATDGLTELLAAREAEGGLIGRTQSFISSPAMPVRWRGQEPSGGTVLHGQKMAWQEIYIVLLACGEAHIGQ